jgi:anthranilate phosphoribosyltransferase
MLLQALDNHEGLPRQIVAYNAGAALYAANLAGSIPDGITAARGALASGAARRKLDQFVTCTRHLAQAGAGA